MRCKYCKEKFEVKYFLQKYCMIKLECIKAYTESLKVIEQKKWNKEKKKRKEKIKSVQELIKEAQIVFNKFIRLRDKGNVCISCQNPPKKKNAGHYFNANNHWNIRFNEDNVHLQCEYCNTHLSGNLILYGENLNKKIGIKRYTTLRFIAEQTRHFSRDELLQIKEKYKKKIKELGNSYS